MDIDFLVYCAFLGLVMVVALIGGLLDQSNCQEKSTNSSKNITIIIKGGEGTYSHQVDITAYSGEKRQTNNNPSKTALMETPIPGGTCAVSQDLKKYLGMRVYISGFGVFRVNDLMNRKFTNRLDLFMASRKKAEDFGKKENIQAVFFRSN